jgi:ABC-type multidrug transport system ATPase subunit
VELVAGRRHYGVFEGNVFFSSTKADTPEINPCNYVPRGARSIYTPGLTYLEMLTYAARLRMNLSLPEDEIKKIVHDRVMMIFKIMDITYCKDRVVPNRPTSRGVLGGELRKLSIATEIINFTPVIILDDCTADLEAIAAAQVVQCLVKMAKKGHTIIASLPRPSIQVFNKFNKVVLVSGGITLFSSARENIVRFFCNRPLDYQLSEDVDISDFILDIADGLERPVGSRRALSNDEIHLQFQQSAYYEPFSRGRSASKSPVVRPPSASTLVDVLPQTRRQYFGYFNTAKFVDNAGLTSIVLRRAFFVKFRETHILLKSMKAMCFMGAFLGYFSWGVGDFGNYVSSLLGIPYPETTNLTAVLFVALAINYGCQVINVHIIGQKIKTFRYEQRAGACPTFGFWLTCILSELPFTIFFALVFSNILYFMGALNYGAEDYFFFMAVQCLVACIGILTALMFTTVFRREIVVRDLFVFCLFAMIMTSGMLFTQSTMRNFVVDVSKINCLRWAYQSIMVWKFKDYPDGHRFLSNYSFENFEKNDIFHILFNFIIFDCAVILLGLLPPPNTLRRRKQDEVSIKDRATKFEKRDSEQDEDRFSNRLTETGGTSLFSRDLSIQNSSQSNSAMPQASAHGLEGDEEEIRGPVVSLVGLTYRWTDRKADLGYHEALSNISCSFPYGQLNGVLGAEASGKSSLLHIIAGQFKPNTVQGSVLFNGKGIDFSVQAPWEVCGFVEAVDNLFRDLSVKEVLTYAMKLRCADKQTAKIVDLQVKKTLDLLKLTAHSGIKIKKLHPGRQRCVAIGEEIVHGPNVILIDEPVSGLGLKYTKIIMNNVLKELANQGRTVITTIHQPTASIFQLYDTLAVLSKGKLVYMGLASEAMSFFIESPNLRFSFDKYTNPAEFLHDISGGLIVNSKGEHVNALSLENNYTTSKLYARQSNHTNFVEHVEFSMENTANPMFKGMSTFNTEAEPEESRPSSVGKRSSQRCGSESLNSFSSVSSPSFIKSICTLNVCYELKMMFLLLERSFFVLARRGKLVMGSTVVIAAIALTFGFIVGESSNESGTVLAVFIMGTLLLIMSNLQLVFFLLKNNEVFLREHSRGLYSIIPYWIINDLPLMTMRAFQSLLFSVIVHEILQLNTSSNAANFFYLSFFTIVLCGTQMVSAIAYTLSDVRDAYSAIPGIAFLLFMFSGLVFKAQTLPRWLAPWLPSVSIIRWAAQGLTINEYAYNRVAFPLLGPQGGYSTYQNFLSLFGWGGKTKWDCFYVVVLNFFVFRVLSLFASMFAAYSQRGKRALIKPIVEERLY